MISLILCILRKNWRKNNFYQIFLKKSSLFSKYVLPVVHLFFSFFFSPTLAFLFPPAVEWVCVIISFQEQKSSRGQTGVGWFLSLVETEMESCSTQVLLSDMFSPFQTGPSERPWLSPVSPGLSGPALSRSDMHNSEKTLFPKVPSWKVTFASQLINQRPPEIPSWGPPARLWESPFQIHFKYLDMRKGAHSSCFWFLELLHLKLEMTSSPECVPWRSEMPRLWVIPHHHEEGRRAGASGNSDQSVHAWPF